jgi:hypothetical protein
VWNQIQQPIHLIGTAVVAAQDQQRRWLHVVTINIEHPAISQCLASYATPEGAGLTPKIVVAYMPVD